MTLIAFETPFFSSHLYFPITNSETGVQIPCLLVGANLCLYGIDGLVTSHKSYLQLVCVICKKQQEQCRGLLGLLLRYKFD